VNTSSFDRGLTFEDLADLSRFRHGVPPILMNHYSKANVSTPLIRLPLAATLISPLKRGAGGGVMALCTHPLSPLSRGELQKIEILIHSNKKTLLQRYSMKHLRQ
jgi:hypothetical protein